MHGTNNNFIVLKPYNQSSIEQLGVCIVKLRHKNKIAKCRSFVVPGDDPALLGMPDIELGIMKIMFDIIEDQQADKKFAFQTMEPSSTLSCKTNTDRESRSGEANVIKSNSNMQDYFRPSMDKETDKRRS